MNVYKELDEMQEKIERLQMQRDQLGHLLQGGSLTKEQVVASGLGEGVLIEQRYAEAEIKKLKEKIAILSRDYIRSVKHLNRLATWAQQDPTGPVAALGVQDWVLNEIRMALGSEVKSTCYQPSTVIMNQSLEQMEKLLKQGLEAYPRCETWKAEVLKAFPNLGTKL